MLKFVQMKQYKYAVVLLFMALSSTATVIAQQNGILSIDSSAAREVRGLSARFELTNEQRAKISSAFKVLYVSNRANVADSANRAFRVKEAQKAYEQLLKEILTSEQFKTYMEVAEARKKRLAAHQQQKTQKQ